jgi:hypothetical protein
MAKELTPLSIVGPGSLGINTKSSSLEIGPEYCTTARNAVVANTGVLAARKGYVAQNSTEIANGEPIKVLHDYIDSFEQSRIISTGNNQIFEGTVNPTDVTGTITTPTGDNWKFVNFAGKCIGVQEDHLPILKENGGDFSDISFDVAPDEPIDALSAFGRVWYVEADRQTIKYSDLLQEGVLDTGSSGVLNMYTVWGNGNDEVVALAEFNNYIVIFGRKQIVLFSGGEDPNNNLQIVDIVNNTGCIARDSVQNIGNDILFLSEKGLISLARNIQAGGDIRSLPVANLADNVSDFLATFSLSEPAKNIKSCYKPDDGYYLITFPTSDRTFYFNLRYPTPDNRARVFVWTGIDPTALLVDREDNLYVGKNGVIGLYDGYSDDGQEYDLFFKTGFTSGGSQDRTVKKIPKQAVTIVRGGYSTELTFLWSYDFLATVYDNETQVIDIESEASQYGISEYSIAEYSRVNPVSTLIYRMSGSGKAIQFGARARIIGAELEIQQIDLYLKAGKVSRRATT